MGSEDKPKLTAAHVRALREFIEPYKCLGVEGTTWSHAIQVLLASGLLDGIEDEEAYNKAVEAWRASHDGILGVFAHNCFRAGWQARAALDGEVR